MDITIILAELRRWAADAAMGRVEVGGEERAAQLFQDLDEGLRKGMLPKDWTQYLAVKGEHVEETR